MLSLLRCDTNTLEPSRPRRSRTKSPSRISFAAAAALIASRCGANFGEFVSALLLSLGDADATIVPALLASSDAMLPLPSFSVPAANSKAPFPNCVMWSASAASTAALICAVVSSAWLF